MKEALQVAGLSIYSLRGKAHHKIVNNISFSAFPNCSLAIVGESGSGKTMTALSFMGLLPRNCYAEGSSMLGTENLLDSKVAHRLRGTKTVLIPQSGIDFLDPVFTVEQQVSETLAKMGVQKKDRRAKAATLLASVGMPDAGSVLKKYPFEISGGMAQRVILAIGMATNPDLIIADEPTRGIDAAGVDLFMERMQDIFSTAIRIIITHNIDIARQCDALLVMFQGEIMEYGPAKTILEQPMHPYTVDLLNSLPSNQHFASGELLPDIIPLVSATGCVYAPRCRLASAECFITHPHIVERNGVKRSCLNA